MPRFALLLIAALALLLGAASAQAAQTAPAAPTARVAEDLDEPLAEDEWAEEDEWTDEDECALDDEDDACLDESWEDEEPWCEGDEAWAEDDEWLAEDEEWLAEDEEWSEDDEGFAEDGEPIAAAATNDECTDEDAEDEQEVLAPELTALGATVAGEDARVRIQVAFRLDQAGPVELTLARVGAAAGKRAKAACPRGTRGAAAKRRGKAKGKRTARRKKCGATLPGRMTVAGKAGVNRVQLRGRWRGKRLAPGGYRLTATPKAPGATSDSVTFKITAR